ncbi:MAG: cobalamin B12-binding domain-containing protein [Pseudomonadota bacterium]
MAKWPNSAGPEKPTTSASKGAASVDVFARQVIEVVATRQSGGERLVDTTLLKRFCDQLIARDQKKHLAFVDHLLASGLRREEICDLYVPAAARVLGDQWCEDQTSFADVTIGSARLQNLLRSIAPEWQVGWSPAPNAPSVLMYVRQDEFHTLGAMVAAGQMRRLGYDVTLHIGYEVHETLQVLLEEPFDIVMISASSSERLESLRKLIVNMRNAADVNMPIAIGGSILLTHDDLKTLTGADYAEADPRRVLRSCGMILPHMASDPTEIET